MPPITQPLQALFESVPALITRLGLAALILILTYLISRWLAGVVAGAARRQHADAGVQQILRRLTRWSVMILGGVLAVEQVIPNVTSLLAGLGIAGLTIGFALQDVAKNLIAGILLLIQRPFELGDTIEVSGFTGSVLDINLRTTDLRAVDGRFVTIPNADVFVNPIINFSRAPSRRAQLTATLPYDSDLLAVREAAFGALQDVEGLLEDPPPEIVFRAGTENTIEFVAYYWADMNTLTYHQAETSGMQAIKQAFAQAGIELAVSTLELIKPNSEAG